MRTIGLDIGTSRLVAARSAEGGAFEYQSQLNAFVTIPHTRMLELSLRRENVPYTLENGMLIVHGNESARFADLLQMETRRPMTKGVLNPDETEGTARLKQLIGTLLSGGQGRVYYTVPAVPLGTEESLTFHEAALKQILNELGYEAKAINEGLAVIYAELESSNYSGLGLSFGGGLVNVCMAYLSVPVLSFAVPKAGDYVDQSASAITGEFATRVRIAKEESFNLTAPPASKLDQVLTVYYDDMIKSVIAGLKEAFANTRNIPRLGRAVPMVLGGGTASPRGFRERFEKAVREAELPIAISEVRMARQPLTASAKGALVAALADEGADLGESTHMRHYEAGAAD